MEKLCSVAKPDFMAVPTDTTSLSRDTYPEHNKNGDFITMDSIVDNLWPWKSDLRAATTQQHTDKSQKQKKHKLQNRHGKEKPNKKFLKMITVVTSPTTRRNETEKYTSHRATHLPSITRNHVHKTNH